MLDPRHRTGNVITGYACRLPGCGSAATFWDLLTEGRTAIGEIGPERFAIQRYASRDLQEAGTSYTFRAGLIDDLWAFDPGFFGFSPREAKQMDPQQRLLLQVAWEALEHAGLCPSRLAPGRTGVYIGASASDYSTQFFGDPARVDAPFMLGNTLSILSNRISYAFDLTGPSYTVDTACSSSFYALDQARRALELGEIDTAIVGAVNVLLSPVTFVGFARAGMLSPNGRCAFLDAGADGYVRAEGAVAFILRRADAAAENGDLVRGRLLATGINSDGRTNGLALPSAARQAALMERLREEAGLGVDDIAFAEAHGTGTRAGDLAEAISLGRVYGQERAAPLPIGSAKTNVGHLEPASGLVGLLKAQLALEHGILPATLNLAEPNPEIDLETLNLAAARAPAILPKRDGGAPWAAVINSFGFGGANAHAILEAVPTPIPAPGDAHPDAPLILSAASAEALSALAASWAPRLVAADDATGTRLINQAAWRRERMTQTLVAAGESSAEIGVALERHLAGEAAPSVITATRANTGRTAFVFSGNGSQWVGMARHLFQTDPVFKRGFHETAELFGTEGGPDLETLLADEDLGASLDRATVGQALLFAVQAGLVQSFAERGIIPDAVAGHSVGEVAAAWCAGALSLGDAVRLIQARASVLEALHGAGGMAAVLSGAETLRAALDAFQDESPETGDITLAADNNPRSTTISGPVAALDAFAKFARTRRLAVKRLDVPYPYHSAAVEPLRTDLIDRISGIEPRAAELDFVSSAVGMQMTGEALGPEFWWLNTRAPVLFRQAVETLAGMECKVFVEIGPRPVLQNYVLESATAAGVSALYVPTLEQGRRQTASMAQIAARAIASGVRHDEMRVFGAPVPLEAGLPAYPWQQAQFRTQPTGASVDIAGTGAMDHPILGWCDRPGATVWHNHLSTARQPWLCDHAVGGAVVFPAAGYAELVLAAGAASQPDPGSDTVAGLDLSGLDILQPLVIENSCSLRTTLSRETGTVMIESSPYPGGGAWVLHARARIRVLPQDLLLGAVADRAPGDLPEGVRIEPDRLYEGAGRLGLDYGPAFRCFAGGRVAGAEMAFDLQASGDGPTGCLLDPGCLDGAMHGLAALIAAKIEADATKDTDTEAISGDDRVFLPVRMGRLQLYRPGIVPVQGALVLERVDIRSVKARLTLYAGDGAPVARLTDLRLRAIPTARRAPLRARFWNQVLEQREGPEPRVSLPEPWADPAARLVELGLTGQDPSAEDAGGLLTDAACRRLAWDAVHALTGPDGRLDAQALGEVETSALPLLGRLLHALEEDALFIRDDGDESGLTGVLSVPCDYPAFGELLCGLRDEVPSRAVDLLALAGLADILPERLKTSGLSAGNTGQRRVRPGPDDGQWALLETALCDLAGQWPQGQRLTVLVLGTPPRDILERLLDHPALTRLTLSDPDSGTVELMVRDLPRHPALEIVPWEDVLSGGRPRDAIVVRDQFCRLDRSGLAGLANLLAEGGLMLSTHPAPDLMGDLVDGQNLDWWTSRAPAHSPAGRRATGLYLVSALADAGFAEPSARSAAGPGREILLVTGSGAPARPVALKDPSGQTPEEDPPARGIFYHRDAELGSAAALLRTALQSDGADEPQLSPLAPLLGVPDTTSWEGIALLQSPGAADSMARIQAGIAAIRSLLDRLPAPERLWLVIPGGCPGAPENVLESPAWAGLWGYGRTLINEHPDLDIRLVDPGQPGTEIQDREAWAARLAAVIATPGSEREILTGPRGLAVPRIESVRMPGRTAKARRLGLARVGGLDDLVWEPAVRRAPGDEEVEIAIRAAGLNFRDVMWAQGLLPEEALEHGFAGPTLGMECAGVVVRAGPNSGFAEGERVVAFASGALATHVTVTAVTVTRIPKDLDFEAAASLPVVFATAQYALAELARVGPGERVLIHGGAGGVGLAALQIARARGARVFATAGTPAKRQLLRAFGAEAVFDSRSLAFADEVQAASDGGVDVVLNALAGEAMERSIGCLSPFGRFVELGKRDFFEDTKIGLYPFHRNLSYFGVDLDELLAERPHEARRVMDDFSALLASGAIRPLPYQAYQAGDVTQAFRLMQRAGHIGKIVLCPPRQAAQTAQATTAPAPVRGGWLIVGGTGGFGLATADALARRGAEKLWLASRTGRPDEAGTARIADLIARGVTVETLALDITDSDAVAEAFARITADRVALRGVVHSAMVLRDRPAQDLEDGDIAAVLAPKIAGAEILDRATRGLELDYFILYSSAVTLFGNPHQAPYVAANMALDRIAAARRAVGEPGLAIGWGAIGDTGYLARDVAARALLDRMLDGAFLTEAEALDGLARWQDQDSGRDPAGAAVSFARLPWGCLAGDLPILGTPLYDRLDEPHEAEQAGDDVAARREELATLPPREALQMVTAILITETAAVLHQPEAEVDPRRPLGEIGFDSLMVVELRLALEEKIGLSLPLLSLADATTLTDVAVKVLQAVRDGGEQAAGNDALEGLVAQHDAGTEDGFDLETKAALRAQAKDVKSLA